MIDIDSFVSRHIGPREDDIQSMLKTIDCESLDQLNSDSYSGVATLDRQQVKDWDCVYLYNTNKTETGWSTSSATANAIRVLKKQAMVTKGNAIVITDVYPTSEWNNNGYEVISASGLTKKVNGVSV